MALGKETEPLLMEWTGHQPTAAVCIPLTLRASALPGQILNAHWGFSTPTTSYSKWAVVRAESPLILGQGQRGVRPISSCVSSEIIVRRPSRLIHDMEPYGAHSKIVTCRRFPPGLVTGYAPGFARSTRLLSCSSSSWNLFRSSNWRPFSSCSRATAVPSPASSTGAANCTYTS